MRSSLASGPADASADWLGVLLIAAACACWAIDNNLTQSLTVRDPLVIVRIKAGVAGTVNVLLAVVIGQRFPALGVLAWVLVVGAIGYGLSVYLDALALRLLGAAREAAVFAVAPFAGALLAPVVLPESFGLQELLAGVLMAAGVALLLNERHEHLHRHDVLDHEHVHVHDEHHRHEHEPWQSLRSRTHTRISTILIHAHPHVSDIHHRHSTRRRRRLPLCVRSGTIDRAIFVRGRAAIRRVPLEGWAE